jgi:type I restriction enzyme S subunit
MNRATFFKHFALLADQPDAVAKMRGLVLELAIRGQLVERNSKDEPAAKLLEKIKTDKREFLRVNKLKDSEVAPQISADEVPFKCPSAWEWVRLGSISNRIHYGYTASADHSQRDVRLLRITDIQDNQVNWETVPGCQISAQEVAKYALHDNDILIARTGGTIGKTFLVASVAVKAVFASYLIRVIPSSQVSARYLKLFLESPCYWRQLLAKSAGTGQPNVNGEALGGLCISLPPLAEQRRIVAKVDELMALCDELEQRQQERQHASGILQQSALHHLLAARDPQAFTAAWQRVRDHFHLLHDTPDAIPQLRQAILQLAVQGHLGPQNPKDESARDTLQRVAKEKEKLYKTGQGGRAWEFKPITAVEVAFDPPKGWQWAHIIDAVERVTVGYVGPMKDEYVSTGIPFLRSQNVRENRFRPDGLLAISREFHERIIKSALSPGDVVVVRSGNVGTTCVIPESLPESNCSDLVVIKRPLALHPLFLSFYLNSLAKVHVEEGKVGVALTHFNTESVAGIPICIPPLAEQKRIVARVEELLRWCDTLEAQLHQTRTLGAHLLASTLHHLLAA